MIGDVRYRTKSGEIVGAKAPDFDESSMDGWDLNLVEVTTVKTAGGLTLMVAAIARWIPVEGQVAPGADLIGKNILQSIRQSSETSIAEILQEAIHSTQKMGIALSGSPDIDLSAVIIALHDSRLYLAQAGGQYAYLLRSGKIIQITPRHFAHTSYDPLAPTLPIRVAPPDRVTVPIYFNRAGEQDDYIDNEIYLPNVAGKQFLDLEPGDGIILSGGPINPAILNSGSSDELSPEFWRAYQSELPSVIAHGLMHLSGSPDDAVGYPVVVIKTEYAEGIVAAPGRLSSLIWQAAILVVIVVISLIFGLAAAFGVPKIMGSGVIPQTGKPISIPPGFLSVIETSSAQYILPGQSPVNLVTGSVIAIQPNTILTTGNGLARVQLSEGTILALGPNSVIVLSDVASASQNRRTTHIRLISGQVLVDAAQSDGTTTIVTSPVSNPSQASGQVVGVQYTKNPDRFDVDCLSGTCQLATPTERKDLSSGQHSTVTGGTASGIDAARYSLWALMCGQACDLPSPTPMPTPYLGAFQWHDLLSPVKYAQTPGSRGGAPQAQFPGIAIITAALLLGYGLLSVTLVLIDRISAGVRRKG